MKSAKKVGEHSGKKVFLAILILGLLCSTWWYFSHRKEKCDYPQCTDINELRTDDFR